MNALWTLTKAGAFAVAVAGAAGADGGPVLEGPPAKVKASIEQAMASRWAPRTPEVWSLASTRGKGKALIAAHVRPDGKSIRLFVTRMEVDGVDRTATMGKSLSLDALRGSLDFLLPKGSELPFTKGVLFEIDPAQRSGTVLIARFRPHDRPGVAQNTARGSIAWDASDETPSWLEFVSPATRPDVRGLRIRLEFARDATVWRASREAWDAQVQDAGRWVALHHEFRRSPASR